MTTLARTLGVSVALSLLHPVAATASPFTYPIFNHRPITTPADPTMFVGVTFIGIEPRLMFDRRFDAFVWYDAFIFDARFSDDQTIEVQLNPEFGTEAEARVHAESYSREIGQLPLVLRRLLHELVIHAGDFAAGGGRGGVLVHTDAAEVSRTDGIWEETLIHEAAHSLDETHAMHPDWLAAQLADGAFISQYAEDNPTREDIAETFLRWFALRYRPERIAPEEVAFILSRVPHRLAYFDAQGFDIELVPEPSTLALVIVGAGLAAARRRRQQRRR